MATISVIQNKLINPLQQYLEKIDLRTDFLRVDIEFKKLHQQYPHYFEELAEELELKWTSFLEKNLIFSFDLLNLQPTDYHLFFEPEYHFNRYRLKTLRNSFYQDIPFFDLQKWKTFCRSKEKEAFKGGLTHEIWTNPLAEKLLNKADEPGYFGGNGSSGWKLHAIANFCLDLYCKQNKIKFYRLTPYDSFMWQSKIELLGNSLKLRRHEKPIQLMISRKIGYQIPQDENKDELS
ncbi:hypothetical protein [Marivirga harenae]|uniref:DUF7255 family protein n=1 Tax=Marivirga harenae TaxID=2010992 RepID=UPI0026E087A4|nr:hypothetical protein [Marivirga harenae]WKV10956.1 hypothetical protein Q3Y49_12105 [Marivirga harenae]|tara:strand:- start:11178 stop:11882 length:705 start_codon:yes stop_codon:yes gene_type:complete